MQCTCIFLWLLELIIIAISSTCTLSVCCCLHCFSLEENDRKWCMMTLYSKEFIKVIGNVDAAHKHKLMLLGIVPSHIFHVSLLRELLDLNEKVLDFKFWTGLIKTNFYFFVNWPFTGEQKSGKIHVLRVTQDPKILHQRAWNPSIKILRFYVHPGFSLLLANLEFSVPRILHYSIMAPESPHPLVWA